MTPTEVIENKKAEYQAELERLLEQAAAFRGAIAACDDILQSLKEQPEKDGQSESNLA